MDENYRFVVEDEDYGGFHNFYLINKQLNGQRAYAEIDEDGFIRFVQFKFGEKPKKLFALSGLQGSRAILQAMADGLKQLGVVAEVDNKQRIAAEAVAGERGNMLDYFKDLNMHLILKNIDKKPDYPDSGPGE